MNRWCAALIGLAVPRHEREWVLGDVEEEYARIEDERGAPGTPLTTADAAFRALMPAMRAELHYPEGFGRTTRLEDLRETTIGGVRSSLGLLMGIVVFVLLIAGANLGTLAVARGSARAKELAVHSAVGASRGAVAVSLLVALIFVVGPALAAGRGALRPVLREGAATQSSAARRTRGAMVAVQIALALVLAIGAGLMLQSLWRLQHIESGMDVDRILTLRLQPSSTRYKGEDVARNYYRDVLARIGAGSRRLGRRRDPASSVFRHQLGGQLRSRGRPAPARGSAPDG